MTGLPETAVLLHSGIREEVQATFVRLSRPRAEATVDAVWWAELHRRLGARQEPEDDEHWSWGTIADQFGARGGWCVGVQTPDNRVQGALAYAAVPAGAGGEAACYIGWIATAPWNRTWLFDPPEYRGTGTKLLLYAAAHSYLLGLKGRLVLNALPSERTTAFYSARGFAVAGSNADGTIVMRLSAGHAMDWLQRERLL